MHVHMLLMKNGKPVFSDDKGYSHLSKTAHYFMGGLLKHIDSLCALTNPSTNSFKRLVPGFEAPVTVGYATSNRSAVIRIPAYAKTPEMRRFELRNPDATCNPYFAYAAILMAGLDGVKKKIDPHRKNPRAAAFFPAKDRTQGQLTDRIHRQGCQQIQHSHAFHNGDQDQKQPGPHGQLPQDSLGQAPFFSFIAQRQQDDQIQSLYQTEQGRPKCITSIQQDEKCVGSHGYHQGRQNDRPGICLADGLPFVLCFFKSFPG